MNRLWWLVGKIAFWLSWPLVWIYIRNTHRTRVLMICEQDILVVRGWLSDGRWGLPGGGQKRNEAMEVAAAREVKEETNIDIEPARLQSLGSERFQKDGLKFFCHYYVVHLKEKNEPRVHGIEISKAAWESMATMNIVTSSEDVVRAIELWQGTQ